MKMFRVLVGFAVLLVFQGCGPVAIYNEKFSNPDSQAANEFAIYGYVIKKVASAQGAAASSVKAIPREGTNPDDTDPDDTDPDDTDPVDPEPTEPEGGIKGIAIYVKGATDYYAHLTDEKGHFNFHVPIQEEDEYIIIFTDIDQNENGKFKQHSFGPKTQEEIEDLLPLYVTLEDD